MRIVTRWCPAVTTTFLLAACREPLAPAPASLLGEGLWGALSSPDTSSARTFDERLDQLGLQVRGFGGLFADSAGIVVLVLDPSAATADEETAVRQFLPQTRSPLHFGAARAVRFERADSPSRVRSGVLQL